MIKKIYCPGCGHHKHPDDMVIDPTRKKPRCKACKRVIDRRRAEAADEADADPGLGLL